MINSVPLPAKFNGIKLLPKVKIRAVSIKINHKANLTAKSFPNSIKRNKPVHNNNRKKTSIVKVKHKKALKYHFQNQR